MKHNGYKQADLIQPLRSKDKNKSDRKTVKGATATPEFDRHGPKTPQGVSPIKKDLSQNKSYNQLGGDKGRPNMTPSRVNHDRLAKASLLDHKVSEREHHSALSKKVTHPPAPTPPEEKLENSFELEEKRIRRENLVKEFLKGLTRVIDSIQLKEKMELIENLRKQSRIYEVQMEYAIQQRNGFLKAEFLRSFKVAAKKYSYHMKLVRNFARILSRPLKSHINSSLEHGFNQVRHLKVALFKPHARKTTKPFVAHTRSNTSGTTSEISKSIPIDTFGAGDSQLSSHIKKTDPKSKPRIKIEENRNEKQKTPLKEVVHKKAESSKEPAKQKETQKKQEIAKPEVQPIKSKELPSKKQTGIVSIKPYSVNSSRDDLNLSSSKVRQSVASDLKQTSVSKLKEESPKKPDLNSHVVPIVDNSNSIMDKHMELKRKLLKQIRGDDGTDTEDLEDSTPKPLLDRPYPDESNKKEISNLS